MSSRFLLTKTTSKQNCIALLCLKIKVNTIRSLFTKLTIIILMAATCANGTKCTQIKEDEHVLFLNGHTFEWPLSFTAILQSNYGGLSKGGFTVLYSRL